MELLAENCGGDDDIQPYDSRTGGMVEVRPTSGPVSAKIIINILSLVVFLNPEWTRLQN